MQKSEALFLIIGTNPMPNMIAISNRVEKCGKVFLISSSNDKDNEVKFSTLKIARKIKDTLNKNFIDMIIDIIEVNKDNQENIREQVMLRVNGLEGIIELNYTGGTKLMASTLYKYFKEMMKMNEKQIILSYLDNIKEKFIVEHNLNSKYSYLENSINVDEFNTSFNLKDIIQCHCLEFEEYQNNYEKNYNDYLYGENFEKLDSKDKLKWISDLELIMPGKDNVGMVVDFIEKYISISARKEFESRIAETKNHKDQIEVVSQIKRYLCGDALEGYFNYIFYEFKEDGLIDEYIWSFKPYEGEKESKDNANAEIDFVIKKGYKIITMSVTLCDDDKSKSKLYEVLTRSAQIAGDESKCIFQCLYKDHIELENYIKNIEFEVKQNLNVIALDNFYNVKQTLLKWI